MTDVLTAHQQQVADRVLAEEASRRAHLVVSLSGAHAYGFPSPDSDLDLKAIHIAPTAALLSLKQPPQTTDRMEVIDGVEIDYLSNELQPVLLGILAGNGNYLERVLGAIALRAAPELAALQPLVRRSLSRKLHRHYRGFATSQLKEWEKSGFASAKKLLYVLRTTLTGAHALSTGEVVTDVRELLDGYGFSQARELIEQKRRGERIDLPPRMAEEWKGRVAKAFEALDQAEARSALPLEAPNAPELEAWLLELRRRTL